jgi:hypothetical protein
VVAAVIRDAARAQLAPATTVVVSVRAAVPDLPGSPDGTAGEGCVMTNPVVRAIEARSAFAMARDQTPAQHHRWSSDAMSTALYLSANALGKLDAAQRALGSPSWSGSSTT